MKPEYSQRLYRHSTIALHLHEYDCRLHLGSQWLNIKAGDLTLSLPQVTSRYEISNEGSHLCIHFMRFPVSKNFTHIKTYVPGRTVYAYAKERMQYIIRNHHLSETSRQKRHLYQAIASTALQDFLLWMSSVQQSGRGLGLRKNPERWEKLENYIDRNVRSRIRMEELTKVMGRSQNYLARCFHRRFGVTIPHYILLRRLDLARQLLSTTQMAVKEVAGEVGIPDPQYFNKKFRRTVGISPTEFRKRELQIGIKMQL
jgi:AraC-like DNA-binding protein